MPENVTQIPAARVPIAEGAGMYASRPWFRYLYNLYAILGGGSLRNGSFHDETTQTAAAINTGYAMTFNKTDYSQGVYIGTPTSRVYVDRPGLYNFQFSAQFVSTNAAAKTIYIWADINGTAVPQSATKITMQGSGGAYLAAWNFFLRMDTGDYFRLMWATDNTNVAILAEAATAFSPGIPSVILTVNSNVGE
jgi:hypothetical protein